MKSLHNTKLKNIVFVLSIAYYFQGYSQQIPDSLNTAQKRAAILTFQMTEQLQLSSNQLFKIDSLNLVYAKKIEEDVIKSDKNRFSKYFMMKKILNEKDDYLIFILSKQQFKIYESMRDEALKNIRKNAF